MRNYQLFIIVTMLIFSGCTKDFLDAKPSSSIITPTTLAEYQTLLDNSGVLNVTGVLPQMASDEYFIVNKTTFNALGLQTYKNSYLWQKDIFEGEIEIPDWNGIYTAVFFANNVLEGINRISVTKANDIEWKNIRGAALFYRSYAFYDLARNFCPVYNEATASEDLGIPLRTSAGIDITLSRANLKQTFDQIISDLKEADNLLRDDFSVLNRNRPSKAAVHAMLARIYLYMGKYQEAEMATDACLLKYNKLINYNTISTSSATPFTYSSDETIFYSNQYISYSATTGYNNRPAIAVDTNLIELYDQNDLRLPIYYLKNTVGNYNVKRGYVGGGLYAFTGLATDEIMLIKAECAARRNDTESAISILNKLLINRYKNGAFVPLIPTTANAALTRILLERRKELVWRSLRWSDLKRLNKEGAGIVLKRNLSGEEYTLTPNSPRYVFPIPEDEIILSGIQQNSR